MRVVGVLDRVGAEEKISKRTGEPYKRRWCVIEGLFFGISPTCSVDALVQGAVVDVQTNSQFYRKEGEDFGKVSHTIISCRAA